MNQLLSQIVSIAEEAGNVIMDVYQRDFEVQLKADRSPLTEADAASHRLIISRLRQLTPDIPVLSEESKGITLSERRGWSRLWLVDPLDGTKEFIKRNGDFTVNIALIEHGQPVLGVVHIPVAQLSYAAAHSEGAYKLNAQTWTPIKANASCGETLQIVASRSHAGAETDAFIRAVQQDYPAEVVSRGSALKLCLVAEGRADLYPRFGPTMEWDTAAAHCVVSQAGGHVTTLSGEALSYNKENLLNPYFMVASPGTQELWTQYLKLP